MSELQLMLAAVPGAGKTEVVDLDLVTEAAAVVESVVLSPSPAPNLMS